MQSALGHPIPNANQLVERPARKRDVILKEPGD